MKKNFRRKVLSNGMTVVFEKRNLPIVSMAFAVKSGGINEKMEEKGISHFIEHMLYKGTKNRTSKMIAEEIERNGGELNGFTGENLTAFHCKMPSKDANIGLSVLSDIMKNSLFDEKELEKERKVIFEEIKMRRDKPNVYVSDRIQELLYENPFGNSLSGTEKSMNSIGRNELVERFNRFYVSSNMILCVVGDYDFDKLIDFCEKNFVRKELINSSFEIIKKNESNIEKRKGIDQANLILAFHSPLADDHKSYAAEILMALMTDGMSSRLFSEIREKRNLAYGISGHANISKDYSYSLVYVGTTKEKVDEVKNLILEEFRKVSSELDEEELNQVKNQMIGNYQISMEDSQSQMISLLVCEIEGGASKFYDFEKNISKVKLEDVKKLAGEVQEGNYSFFALVPF